MNNSSITIQELKNGQTASYNYSLNIPKVNLSEYQEYSLSSHNVNDVSAVEDAETYNKTFEESMEAGYNLLNEQREEIARRMAEEERARRNEQEEEDARKRAELQDLYRQRDENNGLIHPLIEKEIEDEIKRLENELGVPHQADGWEKTYSTVVVGATTIVSGAGELIEDAVDGCIYVGGAVTVGVQRYILDDEEAATATEEKVMDIIAYDVVGEINESIYEGTEWGQTINSASALKYDSETAQAITNATEQVVLFAIATAATVATSGAAAPLFLAGFAVGAGDTAEQKFQDIENRDFTNDSADIIVDGIIQGASTVAAGKSGASLVNGVKTISSLGVQGVKESATQFFSKQGTQAFYSTIKDGAKHMAVDAVKDTMTESDFYLESAAMIADDVKTGIQTGEWDFGTMATEVGGVWISNYVGNFGGEIFKQGGFRMNQGIEAGANGDAAKLAELNPTGCESYSANMADACRNNGMYLEDFASSSQTKIDNLSDADASKVWGIRTDLTSDVTEIVEKGSGTTIKVKTGTEMSKVIPVQDWDGEWYKEGKIGSVANCQSLTRDIPEGMTSTELIDRSGLNYKDTPYVKSDGSRVDEVVVIRYTVPEGAHVTPRASAAIDTSSGATYDYTKFGGDYPEFSNTNISNELYDQMTTNPERLSEISAITGIHPDDIVGGEGVWYNNNANPDLSTGFTLDQSGQGVLGVPEFVSKGRYTIPDAEYYRVDSKGNWELIGGTDETGKIWRKH